MILSFHPCIDADKQIIMGDKSPDNEIQEIIQKSSAVVLPQGCSIELYSMCRSHCAHVFPNYDKRFQFPGKMGQVRLFRDLGVAFPRTMVWENVRSFTNYRRAIQDDPHIFPYIIKTDKGHEGEGIFLVKNESELDLALRHLSLMERSGNCGFITQDFVPCGARALRVVKIGGKVFSYWKISPDPKQVIATISHGARIDHNLSAPLQEKGKREAKDFCEKAQIDLAAIDLIFPEECSEPRPLFLEINYYFGRRGLGGSERYYEILFEEVGKWLEERGLDSSRIRLI
ncbi:MAG: hypothetical protein JRI39_07305 [Deltaproteobacteria bacterium]|nr:hypothetical protein [Deltaproteobacteria bacterium]HDM10751.1 hypothetical protein [Desulfobacteraceae bacterium]